MRDPADSGCASTIVAVLLTRPGHRPSDVRRARRRGPHATPVRASAAAERRAVGASPAVRGVAAVAAPAHPGDAGAIPGPGADRRARLDAQQLRAAAAQPARRPGSTSAAAAAGRDRRVIRLCTRRSPRRSLVILHHLRHHAPRKRSATSPARHPLRSIGRSHHPRSPFPLDALPSRSSCELAGSSGGCAARSSFEFAVASVDRRPRPRSSLLCFLSHCSQRCTRICGELSESSATAATRSRGARRASRDHLRAIPGLDVPRRHDATPSRRVAALVTLQSQPLEPLAASPAASRELCRCVLAASPGGNPAGPLGALFRRPCVARPAGSSVVRSSELVHQGFVSEAAALPV